MFFHAAALIKIPKKTSIICLLQFRNPPAKQGGKRIRASITGALESNFDPLGNRVMLQVRNTRFSA
jgi:hypothetical protein